MLIISRKTDEAFYVEDVLFTVRAVNKDYISIAAKGVLEFVQVGEYLNCSPFPWLLDMKIHCMRTNVRVRKVILGCEGPRDVVVLRKELVTEEL